jgi:hypothetical protein
MRARQRRGDRLVLACHRPDDEERRNARVCAAQRRAWVGQKSRPVNRPGFGGDSSVESQATRLVRSPTSYRASNSAGGLPPQAP